MRTTVNLADDVACAVERLRRERSIGVSEAINELARAGLASKPGAKPFVQRTAPLELRIDVTNTWDAIVSLDDPASP